MMTKCVLALAFSVRVLVAALSVTPSHADETGGVFAACKTEPATKFDVFMLAAKQDIQAQNTYGWVAAIDAFELFRLASRTSQANSLPQGLMERWQTQPIPLFESFKHSSHNTEAFRVKYILIVPDHHPVCREELGHEGNKKRAALLEKVIHSVATQVELAIIDSVFEVYGPQISDIQASRLNLREEILSRTTVIVDWVLASDGQRYPDEKPTKTQSLLKADGVAIRHMRATASLDKHGKPQSCDVVNYDFGSSEEYNNWKTRQASAKW